MFLFLLSFKNSLLRYLVMKLTTDDIVAELKSRLSKEKSIKKKVLMKEIIDLLKEL